MARPSHHPAHRRQVEAMAGYGVPEIDIARVIGVDPKTLRKHYRDELDTGHVKANAKVAENLYRKATRERAYPALLLQAMSRSYESEIGLMDSRGPGGERFSISVMLSRPQDRLGMIG